jgi:hypothetical protein
MAASSMRWTIRDGLAVRFQWFQSHQEALEAAGLSPGPPI